MEREIWGGQGEEETRRWGVQSDEYVCLEDSMIEDLYHLFICKIVNIKE
jgi:hypothetical protein